MRGAALLALALVLPAPLRAQQSSAEAILNRAARAYETLHTFQADFRQKIDDPYVDQPESRGTLYQAGPSRFAMRFTDPAGGAIVIDGQHVWIYEPENMPDQVLRLPMRGDPVYGYNLIGWFLDRPAEKYRASWLRVRAARGHRRATWSSSSRSIPTMRFRRATVWVERESALPRRFEIDEKVQVRTLTLSHIRTNATLPPDIFTFTVPKGVKVVDQ